MEFAGNKQLFKIKLVCGGYHQMQVIDNQATYENNVYFSHFRLSVTITSKCNLEVHPMDVSVLDFQVHFKEEIYMFLLQRYWYLVQIGSQYNNPRLE